MACDIPNIINFQMQLIWKFANLECPSQNIPGSGQVQFGGTHWMRSLTITHAHLLTEYSESEQWSVEYHKAWVCVCVGVWAVCLLLNLNYEWVATVLNSLIWYHCTVFRNAKLAGIKYFRLNLASYWNNVFGGVFALGMAHLLNYLATGWRPYRVTSKI